MTPQAVRNVGRITPMLMYDMMQESSIGILETELFPAIPSAIANSKIKFVILSMALPSCQLAVWEYGFCRTHPGLHAAACCNLGDRVI
jgi:hypothetical protein